MTKQEYENIVNQIDKVMNATYACLCYPDKALEYKNALAFSIEELKHLATDIKAGELD